MVSSLQWHLCWLAKEGWEGHYVPYQLLGSVPIVDRSYLTCPHGHGESTLSHLQNRTIIVIRNAGKSLGGDPLTNARVVGEYARRGLSFAVVVLGDENLVKHPCGWPNRSCTMNEAAAFDQHQEIHPMGHPCWRPWRSIRQIFQLAPFVMRNYWHPECDELHHVLTAPLGVGSGIMQPRSTRRRVHRTWAWTFSSGHSTNQRTAMLSALLGCEEELHPYALAYPLGVLRQYAASPYGEKLISQRISKQAASHYAAKVADATLPASGGPSLRLSTSTSQAFGPVMPNFTAVLCDSHFALCPTGNHVDTWRLSEVHALSPDVKYHGWSESLSLVGLCTCTYVSYM